jgi:hypothetical protein
LQKDGSITKYMERKKPGRKIYKMGFIALNFRRITISFFLLVLIVACTPRNDTGTETAAGEVASITASPETSVDLTGTALSGEPQGTTRQTPQPVITITPTVQKPDIDWREVPIIPEISQRVFQIYEDGQAQGRDPHSFSVIGDCQSIPFVFLGPFGRGILEPDPVESYLWDAIDYFKASFDRWSVTSRGGFTAASILAPIQADPHYCKPGETPLTCEYRLNNPAYVFITLETWLNPDTIDRYEDYLRSILDYVIEKGSVPILLTKADAAEVDDGRHVINPAIVRVARDYDVPVINFWRAAQYLDNIGIDPARDGFHLSQEGYDLKNTLALRALYTIWQAVELGNTTGTTGHEGQSITPTPEPGDLSQTGPQVVIPDCNGGCIFFATADSNDGVISAGGVFAYNYASQDLTQILGTGYDLQDVSEDGQRLLVNWDNFLYEINLANSSATLVSNSFYSWGKQGAYWNSDDSLVILIDQSNPLQTDTGEAFSLFPSSRDGEIYFNAGSCSSKDFCQSGGTYRLDSNQITTRMDSYAHPVISPDGRLMAYLNPAAANRDNYYHISYLLLEDPDRTAESRRIFYFPIEHGFMIYPDVRDYVFSPDNNKLIIIYDVYSAYFEKSMRLQTYLIDLKSGILYDFGDLDGLSASLNPRMVWAPEGNKILFFLTDAPSDDQFNMSIYQTDLVTGEKLTLFDQSILTSSEYFYITNLYWR